jgi:drug/metabolite transporter (DMT)-like permease
LNWALKFLPAYVVNLVLLGEPVGATLIAATLPSIHELPSVATLTGGLLVLAGIYLAMRVARPAQPVPPHGPTSGAQTRAVPD